MLGSQYKKYLDDVEHAASDCAAAVRRLVTKVGITPSPTCLSTP